MTKDFYFTLCLGGCCLFVYLGSVSRHVTSVDGTSDVLRSEEMTNKGNVMYTVGYSHFT